MRIKKNVIFLSVIVLMSIFFIGWKRKVFNKKSNNKNIFNDIDRVSNLIVKIKMCNAELDSLSRESGSISDDEDISLKNSKGKTELIKEAEKKRTLLIKKEELIESIIKKIKSNKYDLNLKNEHGFPVISWAIMRNCSRLVKPLLYSGANPNLKDPEGMNALNVACDAESEVAIKAITDYINDLLNNQNNKGNGSLHFLCGLQGGRYNLKNVKNFLNCRPKINLVNKDGKKPLDIAGNKKDLVAIIESFNS